MGERSIYTSSDCGRLLIRDDGKYQASMRFTTHIFGGLEVHDRALWLAYVSSVGRHGLQGEHARLARRKVVPRGKRCHQAFARQAGRGNDDEVWMRQQTVSKNGAVIHGTLYTKIMHGSLITQVCTIFHVPGPAVFRNFFFFFKSSLLTSSSTRRRFYPQRSSGQAVVTGVVPSPPRYVSLCLPRIGFSIPNNRRFSSNVETYTYSSELQNILFDRRSSSRGTVTHPQQKQVLLSVRAVTSADGRTTPGTIRSILGL